MLVSSVLCVFKVLNSANWHEAPWTLGFFCSFFYCEVDTAFSFTSTAMIQIYILGTKLMSFKKQNIFQCHIVNNSPIRPSKSLLKSPSGEGNHSLPGLSWFERHNLIGWFFCQKRFHWLTQSTGLNNPVLSESTESSDNVQLTICTPVL